MRDFKFQAQRSSQEQARWNRDRVIIYRKHTYTQMFDVRKATPPAWPAQARASWRCRQNVMLVHLNFQNGRNSAISPKVSRRINLIPLLFLVPYPLTRFVQVRDPHSESIGLLLISITSELWPSKSRRSPNYLRMRRPGTSMASVRHHNVVATFRLIKKHVQNNHHKK